MHRHPRQRAATILALIGVTGWLLAACSDYVRLPISLGDQDGGARVVVEPDDEFEIGLLGHPAHPEAAWAVTEVNEALVEIREQGHEPKGTIVPDDYLLSQMPETVQEIWSTLPDPEGPPDVVDENEGELWFYPFSFFLFAGKDYGDSDVTLELRVADEVVHTFQFSVSVVEDACDYYEGEDSSTMVPHRCG